MTTATKSRKAEKSVQIIARISFKDNPAIVVYLCRSSRCDAQYTTTLYNGCATGCDCPARKPCYHMTGCEAREAKRNEQLTGAAAVAPVILGEMHGDLGAHIEDSIESGEMAIGTCATCPNSVKPGFVFCPWCSGSAAA